MLLSVLPYGSQEPLTDSLHAVTVTADKGVIVSRKDSVKVKHCYDVSEALLRCPGLFVGDNGGMSGLKTVSLRGLGTAHTSIYIDGVRVGNLQSGQNDLGMLDASMLSSVAVDYAQNSISFDTERPQFGSLPFSAKVGMYAGSFGTYLPSASFGFRLSDSYALSASASGVFSKGNFRYGDNAVRTNNDLTQGRASLDLWGVYAGGDMHVKAYYNDVSRGAPGSVAYPSDDRQKDRNAFVQGVFRKRFSSLYSMIVSTKGAYDHIFYTSSYGESTYDQAEVQVNTSHFFRLSDRWSLSAAADLHWDGLYSTSYDASRTAVFTSVSSSYRYGILSADIAVEYYGTFDKGQMSRHAWSPSFDLRVSITEEFEFTAFGRRAYRVPVFNELYYVGFGNPELRPEDAWLADMGFEYDDDIDISSAGSLKVKAKFNGFCNFLRDKIISAPSPEDPNIWAPYNIGKVRSTGLDALCGVVYRTGDLSLGADLRYSFQSAVDKSDGGQVPYIAKHTVNIDADASWRRWRLFAIWQMRSRRCDSYGDMPDWNTLDISFGRSFRLDGAGEIMLKLSARNVCDSRYEVTSGYPMPGRSIMGGFEYRF